MATRDEQQSTAGAASASTKRKRENEEVAKRPENQPLIDALIELSNAAFESADNKGRFKGASFRKAALELAKLDTVIKGGKELANGPKKVPGVGPATAYYIDEFLETGQISEIETYRNKKEAAKVSPASSPTRAKTSDTKDVIKINRAPVLTLWVTVVAERQGFNSREALTYGKWISGVFAHAKGRSLGIIEDDDEPHPKRRRAEDGDRVQVFEGVKIPVVERSGSRLAVSEGEAINHMQVESYLESKFGSRLVDVKEAMEILANSMTPETLRKRAYHLYEEFRPTWKGWGQKGDMDLNKIRDMAN